MLCSGLARKLTKLGHFLFILGSTRKKETDVAHFPSSRKLHHFGKVSRAHRLQTLEKGSASRFEETEAERKTRTKHKARAATAK